MDYREKNLVRHLLAAMAYRAALAVEDAPVAYAHFDAGEGAFTPLALLRHMTMLAQFTVKLLGGPDPVPATETNWEDTVAQFYGSLRAADNFIKHEEGADSASLLSAVQGPLSDLTHHAGQLCLLRRLAGESRAQGPFSVSADKGGAVSPNDFVGSAIAVCRLFRYTLGGNPNDQPNRS